MPFRRVALICLIVLCAAAAGSAQTYQWQKRLFGAGLGNPFSVNPSNDNTLYVSAGGAGAIFVSRDRGASWDTLGSVAGGGFIKAICVSPSDSLVMLAGVELSGVPDRVARSTDGGATWTPTLQGEFGYFGVPLESSPYHPDTVITMMGQVIYRSTDFGSSWAAVNLSPGFNTWCDAALRPDSAAVIYVGDNTGGIWKSADGGASFRNVYASAGEIPMIAIDEADPAVAYATKFFGAGSGVVKTTDYGETWSEIAAFQGFTQCWGIAVDRSDHNRIIMGTYTSDLSRNGVYLSLDGGANWTRTLCGFNKPYSLNYGLLALDSLHTFALQDEGVFALDRIDLRFYPRGSISGSIRDSSSGAPLAGTLRLTQTTCDSTATIVREADSSGAFRFDELPVSDGALDARYTLSVDPQIPYAQESVSGLQITSAGADVPLALSRADVFVVAEDSGRHESYYLEALSSLGYKTSFWNTLARGPAPLARGIEFADRVVIYYTAGKTSPLSQEEDSNLVAAIQAGCHLLLTGQDLLERNPSAAIFASVLGVSFGGNAPVVYCEGTPGEILDGVSFFTNSSGADYAQSRDILLASNPETTPIAGYGPGGSGGTAAVLRKLGTGTAVYLGFGFETVNPIDKRRALMERFLLAFLNPLSVEEGASGRPTARLLAQNFPNPFNPTTTVRFALPVRSIVTVAVCDILGRTVASPLVRAELDAGEHSVVVDGAGLASGVYVYRIAMEEKGGVRRREATSGKMILAR